MFSRARFRVCALCRRLSKNEVISGLCLESRLGQNRCVEGIDAGCMGGYLCSGGDVMNRRAESCVYQWLCSGWKCRLIARKGSLVSEIVCVNCKVG